MMGGGMMGGGMMGGGMMDGGVTGGGVTGGGVMGRVCTAYGIGQACRRRNDAAPCEHAHDSFQQKTPREPTSVPLLSVLYLCGIF